MPQYRLLSRLKSEPVLISSVSLCFAKTLKLIALLEFNFNCCCIYINNNKFRRFVRD